MDISIRPLTPADVAAFRAIRLEALQAHPELYTATYEESVARPDDWWIDLLSGGDKCLFGLFDGAELIGITAVFTSSLDPTGATGLLAMSYIRPEYRGRGLSRHLYEARIRWAVDHPEWTRLVVGHRDGNERSRRAMLASGFHYIQRERITWPDGSEDWALSYELDLEDLRTPQK